MGDQRKLAENDGAPRMRVASPSSRPPPASDLEWRRMLRRVERLERKVRALERAEAERKAKREFEAGAGDV